MLEFSHDGGRIRFFILPEEKQVRFMIRGQEDDFDLVATVPLDAELTAEGGALDEVLALVKGQQGEMPQRIKSVLLLARAASEAPRAETVLRHLARWIIGSNEKTNYTYHLTPLNIRHAVHTVALVTGDSFETVSGIFDEVLDAPHLDAHMAAVLETVDEVLRQSADAEARFGRRMIWYALVRLLKPRLVVETGVDQGLGALALCEALRRNTEEGAPGRYIGTDKREDAGQYVAGAYEAFGTVMIGDSLESLDKIEGPIDMFINDSDHSADYEAREYQAIAAKLSEHAVILSDNAHSTSKLDEFALETGRQFVFFREQSTGHWYPGAGVGIAWFPSRVKAEVP